MDYPPLVDPQPGAMTAQFVSDPGDAEDRKCAESAGTYDLIKANM
jgi:hypothetical protein